VDPESYPEEVICLAKLHRKAPAEVAAARRMHQAELEALLEAYLRGNGFHWELDARLTFLQDRAAPYLVEVLKRDDAFVLHPAERNGWKDSRGSQALRMLKEGTHEQLKPVLRSWLHRTSERHVLATITSHFTSYGSDDLLPDMKCLFEHEDEYIAGDARRGALQAFYQSSGEPAYRSYVWNHCVGLLLSKNPPAQFDPIRVLIRLDSEGLKKLLIQPEILREDHPLLAQILGTLNTLGTPAPAEFLRRMLETGGTGPEFRKEHVRRSALFGLLRWNDPSAAEHIEVILKKPKNYSDAMVLAAWEARFKMHGLSATYDTAFDVFEKTNYESLDSLTAAERDIILMHYLEAEVQNGGLWQWYYNPFGDYARETANALRKVGGKKHAEIIETANSLFGPAGPSSDRETRQRELAAWSDDQAERLSRLEGKFGSLPSWLISAAKWEWKQQTRGRKT
jgi:hypothetical protein